MTKLLPAWLAISMDAFRRLAEQPAALFCVLLAINALARPYANCTHDARLYGLQAMNHAEGGAFADDVFLRYGSQDQYSLFSRILGPLVALTGVRAAFFGLYLIFNTLFIWGLFRLVRGLIHDPFVSTSALIFLVSAELNYGGHAIFTVHEQFFTPRLVATAMTLHALAFLMTEQFAVSLGLLAVGMMFHPLMAFGGVLIWLGCLAKAKLSSRAFLIGAALAGLGAIALLLIRPIGERIFGQMDDDWHDMVRTAVLYNYPTSWAWSDWINHALAFVLGIVGFAWLFREDAVRSRFLFVATLVGIVGLLATWLASCSPYALLFQGQPYRAVWILKVLQVPLGFLAFARLCEMSMLPARLLSIGLAAFFLIVTYADPEFALFLFVAPLALFYWRKIDEPLRPDWWWRAALTTLVGGAAAWMLYRWGFILAHLETMMTYYDRAELLRITFIVVPAVFWIAGVLLVLRWAPSEAALRPLAYGCLVLALSVSGLHFALDAMPETRIRLTRYSGDIAFARQVIETRGAGRVPTVYSSLGRADYIWLDLHATSYYDAVQTAGVMFRRDTALELRRRIPLVKSFELARLRKEEKFLTEDAKKIIEHMYQAKFDGPGPSESDLIQLCAEPGLDFVVIPHEFPGLYSATNGRIYVYECSRLRLSKAVAHATPRAANQDSPKP